MSETVERESDGARLARMGTDAAVWAQELVATAWDIAEREGSTFAQVMNDPDPGGWLHGWLCAAIEAGRSAGYSQACRDVAERLPVSVQLHAASVWSSS